MSDAREEVARLRARGFAVCRPNPRQKKPTYRDWSTRSLGPDDFKAGDMAGIMSGPLSDGGRPGHATVILDIDGADALALADKELPATAMVEGRPGKPRSHRYYLTPLASIPDNARSAAKKAAPAAVAAAGHPGPRTRSFRHRETDKEILKLCGTGTQCVCPPSLWRGDDGKTERREWEGGEPGEPAVVAFPELWEAICRLTARCGAKLEAARKPAPAAPAKTFAVKAANGAVDKVKRASAYLAKIPGAVSNQGGHDQTFTAARAVVWGFDLGPDLGFDLLWNEYNPRCRPEWEEHELRHKCREADTVPCDLPRGWLLNAERKANGTHAGNGHHHATDEAPGDDDPERPRAEPEPFLLAGLTLVPGTPRRTAGGKVVVTLRVMKAGKLLDEVPLTSSSSGRREAERLILRHAPDGKPEDACGVIARLIGWAVEKLDSAPAGAQGPTVRDVVKARVPAIYELSYRTERGLAWSENRGAEVSRTEFVNNVPGWLMDAAAEAVDAPRDLANRPDRLALLRAVGAELTVLWSDVMEALPTEAAANLGAETAAGKKFRQAMVRLWTKTMTFEVSKTVEGTSGETVAARASLVSRVRTAARDYLAGKVTPQRREKWRDIQKGFSAWWRPAVVEGGETVVLLSMRWDLVGQVCVELPGVHEQGDLMQLGTRYGCVMTDPPVAAVLSGGHRRLAVLSLGLADELLEIPDDDPAEEQETVSVR